MRQSIWSAVVVIAGVLPFDGPAAEAQVVTYYYHPATAFYGPPPVAAYPAPAYVAPAPVVAYYAPPPVVYQPTARVRTRYRPILGGTVSRVRYGYTPVYYP
jgi:hypothetical protein